MSRICRDRKGDNKRIFTCIDVSRPKDETRKFMRFPRTRTLSLHTIRLSWFWPISLDTLSYYPLVELLSIFDVKGYIRYYHCFHCKTHDRQNVSKEKCTSLTPVFLCLISREFGVKTTQSDSRDYLKPCCLNSWFYCINTGPICWNRNLKSHNWPVKWNRQTLPKITRWENY